MYQKAVLFGDNAIAGQNLLGFTLMEARKKLQGY